MAQGCSCSERLCKTCKRMQEHKRTCGVVGGAAAGARGDTPPPPLVPAPALLPVLEEEGLLAVCGCGDAAATAGAAAPAGGAGAGGERSASTCSCTQHRAATEPRPLGRPLDLAASALRGGGGGAARGW